MMKIKGLQLPMIADEIITGDIRWVGNTVELNSDTAGAKYGKDPDKTFATIDYGISRSTASQGDYLIVLPGHTENIILTTTIDMDIAGLTLLGLGHGSARPTLTQTVVAMYLDMAAANLKIKNFLFMAGVNTGTGAMINVIGDDAIIDMCEFKCVSNVLHTNHMIEASGANTADGMIVKNCRFDTMACADADVDSAISLAEVQDRVQIIDNYFWGTFDDAAIHNVTGKTCTNLTIARNTIYQTQAGDHAIEIVSACTGVCKDNRLYASSWAAMLDPGSLICSGNKGAISVDQEAVSIPGTGNMGEPRLTKHTTAAMSAATYETGDHPTIFTITGTVLARCWGVVTTGVTSSSDTGTIELGTTDDLNAFIATTTVGSGTLAAGDVWSEATVNGDSGQMEDDASWVLCNDTLVEMDINTKDMSAGVMDIYCQWVPISAGADVVAS